ncbi:carbohydrate-binding protein [Paenibacillus macerans]|uniref:carbohydrate-binding protein n=1 Tax=Paenibacillus macerans TaxID=44252 RepID=UPI003D31D43A
MKKYGAWLCIVAMLVVTFWGPLGSSAVQAAGGPNLALGKPGASSGYNDVYIASNAFDNNQSTYWESTNNAFPQWIQTDLGNAASIDRVVLKIPAGWESRTQTLSVQGSLDGSSFSSLVGSAPYAFDPAAGNTVTIDFAAASARYVRVVATANTAWPAAQFSEVEVYGSTGEPGGETYAIPGKIEAEAYSAMNGIQTENTSDTGGGQNVGWIHVGDWLDYNVNVQTAGNYTVEYRVASNTASGQIQLRSGTTTLATTAVPNTGGWQNWQTVTANVTLNAGAQTLRVYASGFDFNLNWFNFAPAGSADTQAPMAPGGLTFTQPDAGTIRLAWNASTDNVGVAGYDVYANGQLRGSVGGSALTYSDSQPATATVTYYVVAKDAAGNASSPSNAVTRTGSGGGGDGTNLASGKPISASSSTFTFVAANANDNNLTTYWEGNGQPGTLTVDLGANANLTSVVLKLNPSSEWGARTQTIQVLGREQNAGSFTNLVSAAPYTFNPATQNTVSIPVSGTASSVQLRFTANTGAPGGQIAEFQVLGTPAPNPDLTVTSASWSPVSPVETDALVLSATVRNSGTAASPATNVGFYLNGTLAGTAPVGALAAGASATVSANVGAKTAASYAVNAKVDENNTVIESNEANNSYTHSAPLVVAPVASSDLVGTVTWTPSNPVAGNAVSFNVNLKNQGTIASAGGAHGVTVVLKNAAGATLQTLNGSYNGTLAAGANVNVAVPGTWTAADGSYAVQVTVAADANELAVKRDNNNSSTGLTVYAPRGASMPYFRYDTDEATRGGGAALMSAPTFDQALTASEASGQKFVALPSNGSYAQWTVKPGQGGDGVTMRFTLPDSSDGMGQNGSLDVYVNGTKVKNVPLTSYYSWQYFSSDHPADAPGSGRPLFRFDEVHWKLDTPLVPGDTIRIQKGSDSIEYGVDFIEIEPVPAAVPRPANAVSVTDFGAVANDGQDDLAAFRSAVSAAVAEGKTLYIPTGTFHLGGMWEIGSPTNMINNLKVTGAGIWHTNLQFTNPNKASGGISLRISGQLDFSNVYMNSNLRSRYNQEAIYKAFMDNFGTHSKVHNVWVEHFECGFWVGDYAHTPATIASGLVIENSRIRNNLADGVNFAQGTSNSIVRNSSLRNNGDDALAIWTSNVNGAPAGVNNEFSYNTIENNWRAGAIGIFGGSGHKATRNLIIDTVGGSGIRMNTVFPGYHFQNNTGIVFSDTTIINSGTSKDLYNGERGAIDLEASGDSIRNVTFSNIDIIGSQRDAIQFGYGGGFQNIVFNNITIDGTGLDGVTTSRFSGPHLGAAIFTYTNNGAATFNNLVTRNVAYPGLYYIQNGFNLTIN